MTDHIQIYDCSDTVANKVLGICSKRPDREKMERVVLYGKRKVMSGDLVVNNFRDYKSTYIVDD